MKQSNFSAIAILSCICIISHGIIFPASIYWINSDFANHILWVQNLDLSHFSPFTFQQKYGGVSLSMVRAFFCWMWPAGSIVPHLIFSFLITPLLLLLAVYFALRQTFSLSSTFLACVPVAVGLQFLVQQLGNDIYFGALILGTVVLGLRARWGEFWLLDSKKQFGFALLCGFAIYTFHASLIYVVACLLPKSLFKLPFEIGKNGNRLSKYLLRLSIFLFLLYVIVKMVGSEFTVYGKLIKIHAWPNLQLSLEIFALAVLTFKYKATRLKEFFLSIFILLAGVAIGSSPEWVSFLIFPQWRPPDSWQIAYLQEVIALVKESFIEHSTALLSGYLHERTYPAFLPLIVAIYLIMFLGFRRSREIPEFALYALCLAIVAFLTYKTYVLGAPRYLVFAFPPLLYGVAGFFESIQNKMFTSFALVVGLVWCADQTFDRFVKNSTPKVKHRIEETELILKSVKYMQLPIIVSDNYWYSNQYQALTSGVFRFVSNGREWGDPKSFKIAKASNEIGVLLTKPYSSDKLFSAFGNIYQLKLIEKVTPEIRLLLGTKIQP